MENLTSPCTVFSLHRYCLITTLTSFSQIKALFTVFGVYILSIRLEVSLLAAWINCVNIMGLGLGLSMDSPTHPTYFCLYKESWNFGLPFNLFVCFFVHLGFSLCFGFGNWMNIFVFNFGCVFVCIIGCTGLNKDRIPTRFRAVIFHHIGRGCKHPHRQNSFLLLCSATRSCVFFFFLSFNLSSAARFWFFTDSTNTNHRWVLCIQGKEPTRISTPTYHMNTNQRRLGTHGLVANRVPTPSHRDVPHR